MTSRGKPKKITPTNVLNIDPFGVTFDITIDSSGTYMRIINFRACSQIFIGEEDRVANVRNNEDFQDFMEYYISTCPENYFEKVNRVKTAKHKTVKYKTGDIFRVEVDRFNYTYGLITGIIKDFKKWEEYPEEHSFNHLMGVPIAVRLYDIETSDDSLTAEDLEDVPLDIVRICFDNDIIWGTHPIVDHKELTEDDVQFNLVCTKRIYNNEHHTIFTDDFLIRYGQIKSPIINTIYVEWGFANVYLDYACMSQELKQMLQEYSSPYGGVKQIIRKPKKKDMFYRDSLFSPDNDNMRKEIFAILGLSEDSPFDDFAGKFGGLTKSEIVKRINGKSRIFRPEV